MKLKTILTFLCSLVMLMLALTPLANAVASATGWSIHAAGAATIGLSLVVVFLGKRMPRAAGRFHINALQVEIWQSDIIEALWKNNQFAEKSINHDEHVLAGKVVHLPVAGDASGTKRNLTQFPQSAVERTDSELTYALDTYYALPRRIANIDQYESSYNKRESVIGQDVKNLVQNTMNGLLYNWAPSAANVIETVGDASADDLIDSTATGSRKLFTKAAFKTMAKKFGTADYEGFEKIALLTEVHYWQFFESLSDAEKTNIGRVADLAKGIVGEYMGFTIMKRSSVLRYRKNGSNVWTVVDTLADGYAPAAGDCATSLFYAVNAVTRAVGSVEVFDNQGQALYYGDVWSATLRMGGRRQRPSGVWAVAEAAA